MGEVLYFAFCQGDQTFRRRKIFLFLKFCILSRMIQGLLLRQESSLYPIAECHQIWTRWTGSLSWWQWVQCLVREREWLADRVWLSWDRNLHCWIQTQVKHCNNVPEIVEDLKIIKIIFFCICKNWVEAQISLSHSSGLMSKLALFFRVWRWVTFSKMLPSLFFNVVSISGNKFFTFALL